MFCPKCEVQLEEDDFKLTIFGRQAEIVMTCPECGYEVIIGFGQEDLEEK